MFRKISGRSNNSFIIFIEVRNYILNEFKIINRGLNSSKGINNYFDMAKIFIYRLGF